MELFRPLRESGADAGVCSAAAQCHYEEAGKRIEKALNDANTPVSQHWRMARRPLSGS